MKIEALGETKVFRKDFSNGAAYSIQIGRKKPDETWENAYMPVKFRQGIDIKDGTKIDVEQGWLTFYINKENKAVWQIFINKFRQLDETPEGFQAIEDDEDIPPFLRK